MNWPPIFPISISSPFTCPITLLSLDASHMTRICRMEGNLQITCPLTQDSSTVFSVIYYLTVHGSIGPYGHGNHGYAASGLTFV